MARTSNAKPAAETVAVEEIAATVDTAAEEMSAEIEKPAVAKATVKKSKPVTIDKDEIIEVVSLIPNVYYKDNKYGDLYEWEKPGMVADMPFEVVNSMWQKNKTYFKSMWLKPLDDRVVKKFGLESVYSKYDFLLDASNYTRENINEICNNIRQTPSSLKMTICNKVKSFVATGEVSDIKVLREIEKSMNIDLIPLIS